MSSFGLTTVRFIRDHCSQLTHEWKLRHDMLKGSQKLVLFENVYVKKPPLLSNLLVSGCSHFGESIKNYYRALSRTGFR